MDALRVVSMLAVAAGHWLLAVVTLAADGSLRTESLLVVAPAAQWSTWLLQVVPLFVVVAGWSSARSLHGASGSGGASIGWVHARVRRLLLPTTAYVLALALAAPLLTLLVGSDTGALVGRFLGVHLWFTAAISVMWLLTPWLHAVWQALGPRALVATGCAVLTVDVAVQQLGLPLVGWANFVLVFSFATLLGFAWHDGRLTRRVAARMVGLGVAGLLLAAASPWYPLSLVGVPGAAQSNNSPLTVCMVLVAVLHVGAVVLAAPRLRRVLERPGVWLGVVVASRVAVTVYLWHLAGLALLVGLAHALAPSVLALEPLTATWWATRPLWIAALVLATVPLVWLAARVEQRPRPAAAPGRVRVLLATGLAVFGCAQVALVGAGAGLGEVAVLVAALVGRWVPGTERRPSRPAM
jgi:surface polysaccharide O-acyltransferase-like enzyme